MRCPRRRESPNGSEPGEDTFSPGHGMIGQPTGCSWCGSMDPEDFLKAAREGAQLGPTDKSYKCYIDFPKPGVEVPEGKKPPMTHGKFYFQHFSPAQQDEFIQLHNDRKLNIGYPSFFYVTPYFAMTLEREH